MTDSDDTNPYDTTLNNDDNNDEHTTTAVEQDFSSSVTTRDEKHPDIHDEDEEQQPSLVNDKENDQTDDDDSSSDGSPPELDRHHHPQEEKLPQETHEEEEEGSFWHRFSSIPIVQDSVGKVQQYPLGRYALEKAETTWTKASTQAGALPYAQAYFEKAGALGCLSLDVLEQRFPVVYQPTEQIVDTFLTTVKAPVHHAVSLVDRFWWTNNSRNKQPDDPLNHLSETKALLQETAHHIARINDSLRGWTTCVASQVGSQLKGSYESTQAECNQRILELTTELVTKLDSASAYAKTVSIPPAIQARLEPLVAFYDTMRHEAVKEDLSPLQKASRMVILTQSCVLPALQSSIDGIQEQLKYYTTMSKGSIKGQLNSFGIHASS
ncbi:hypothetical protein BDA99DRAFT_504248 [Phascolomyces articulosus]|uniref:Uncharacterized protein n=1 Tax=Phascolomyces articulosus TaxID=60185 RepID=A0AAD5K398_9FUNG|nr:hypothetical protein BDA99DRAFT_504248 [Phascolomyces articulosus]